MNIIEKLEEVIYQDKKNEKRVEQKLVQLGKRLYIKNKWISCLKIEL